MKKKVYFLFKYILGWFFHQLKFVSALIKKENQILIYNSLEIYMNNYALYKYLLDNNYNNKYKIIYAMPNACILPKEFNVVFVDLSNKKNFIKTLGLFMRSKYVFYDNSNIRIPSTNNQKIINLWHGTPLKKIGFMSNAATILPPNALNCFDKILLSNDIQDDIYIKSFRLKENQILHAGYPRNDLIFSSSKQFSKIIEDYHKYEKHILWMTTYRVTKDGISHTSAKNWSSTGIPLLINDDKLIKMNDFLSKNNIQLIIKMHNNNSQDNIQDIQLSNIKYLSENDYLNKGIQLYELLNETDALITDYSSIYFDYLLTNKPIGFILDDYEDYIKANGLYYDDIDYYLPGEHIYNYEELKSFFIKIKKGIDEKEELRNEINSLFNKYDLHGKNCKWLLDELGII